MVLSQPAPAALQRIPDGRNAIIIMAIKHYDLKIAGERVAIADTIVPPSSFIVACSSDQQCPSNPHPQVQHSHIDEFMGIFSERTAPRATSETRKRRRSRSQ